MQKNSARQLLQRIQNYNGWMTVGRVTAQDPEQAKIRHGIPTVSHGGLPPALLTHGRSEPDELEAG